MNVLVFKTSLLDGRAVESVAPTLNRLNAVERWTVDLEDCDRVLRVETNRLPADAIVQTLWAAGFTCEELP